MKMLIMMMLNMMFMNSNNPLIMGFTLLIQTMMISMMVGKLNLTFWMSFIIFLVFVGGMLILFIYVVSLINNNKLFFYKINMFLMMIFMLIIIKMINMNFIFNNYETNLSILKLHLNIENSINLIKLYNMPNLLINIMLIIYLFIMLIIISKITNFKMGPFFKK